MSIWIAKRLLWESIKEVKPILVQVVFSIVLTLCISTLKAHEAAGQVTAEDIRLAISHTLRPVFYGRLLARDEAKQLEIAKIIVKVSRKYSHDPYLITSMGYCESSFRKDAIGVSKGEIGLLQVHGVAAKGCNLDTIEGQADCGAKWLREKIDQCGSLRAGLTAYVSKSCKAAPDSRAAFAVKRRLKIALRLRKIVTAKKNNLVSVYKNNNLGQSRQ